MQWVNTGGAWEQVGRGGKVVIMKADVLIYSTPVARYPTVLLFALSKHVGLENIIPPFALSGKKM